MMLLLRAEASKCGVRELELWEVTDKEQGCKKSGSDESQLRNSFKDGSFELRQSIGASCRLWIVSEPESG
jgi:hypothetical protein